MGFGWLAGQERLGHIRAKLPAGMQGRGGEMWDEDVQPIPQRLPRIALEPLGVAELQAYIAELHAEIARAEVAIARKQDHRGAADRFFKTPDR